MKTLDLKEAAEFLKMNTEVLRRKATSGEIPGRKPGKRWVFVQEYLADWLKGDYATERQVAQPKGGVLCLSTNEEAAGTTGSRSPSRVNHRCREALGLPIGAKRRSTTTS
jgi:hypothetical protein